MYWYCYIVGRVAPNHVDFLTPFPIMADMYFKWLHELTTIKLN